MSQRVWMIRIASLSASLLLLAACGGEQEDLRRYINEVQARPAAPIEPIPPVRTYEPVAYTAREARNPFLPLSSEEASGGGESGTGPRPDPDRPKEYLERFSLDTLAMVGTLTQGPSDWALIEDTEGVVHRVRENNYVGQNHGRVVRITDDEVILSELIPDGSGGWLEREATIALEEI